MKVLTVGGATQDIFIQCKNLQCIEQELCSYIALAEGQKIEIDKVLYSTGGGATNSAASFSLLQNTTDTFFKYGADHVGAFIINKLQQQSITTDLALCSPDYPSGLSFIIPSPSKDRAILTLRGANAHIQSNELPLNYLAKYDIIYVTSMTGQSSDALITLVQHAHQHNIPVVHNPGSSQLANGADKLREALPYINTLILNMYEATLLYNSISDSSFNLKIFCKSVMNLGPQIVAITDGANGVYVAHDAIMLYHPALQVTIANTIGAGDAFGSCFTSYITSGAPIEQALLSGIINAASVISHLDTTTGLLNKADIDLKYQQLGLSELTKAVL